MTTIISLAGQIAEPLIDEVLELREKVAKGPTTQEMLERGGRALFDCMKLRPKDSWDNLGEWVKQDYRRQAATVLNAVLFENLERTND